MGDIGKLVQVGQTVRLEELAFGFRITVLAADEPGHKIVEIGQDYLVVEDEAAAVRTRIPVFSVKVVTPTPPVPQAA
jgi:hypothetical protein